MRRNVNCRDSAPYLIPTYTRWAGRAHLHIPLKIHPDCTRTNYRYPSKLVLQKHSLKRFATTRFSGSDSFHRGRGGPILGVPFSLPTAGLQGAPHCTHHGPADFVKLFAALTPPPVNRRWDNKTSRTKILSSCSSAYCPAPAVKRVGRLRWHTSSESLQPQLALTRPAHAVHHCKQAPGATQTPNPLLAPCH